jgi:ornithine cyclodeaminase/alanine dehydrogenase
LLHQSGQVLAHCAQVIHTTAMNPAESTLFLTDGDVRALFDWRSAVDALRTAYAAADDPKRYPPRSMARGDRVWLRALTGIAPDGRLMGAKLIAASMRRQRASYLIPLFDQESAMLLALLDGNSITGFRTAATSILAADCMAPARPLDVAVIGSGFEAKTHVRALAAVRSIARVRVFSPNPASRARFIDELADLGLAMAAADSAREAVAEADLVLCAARSRDESPTLRGQWLSKGATVVSIGSTLPEQREVDTDVIALADRIVADMVEEVVHDTGDMLAARKAESKFEHKVVALSEVVGGKRPGRASPDEILLYKSVGACIQDLAVATMCFRRALERGVGTPLPVSITSVDKSK